MQPSENDCRFITSTPLLDDVENLQYNGKLQINVGHSFITASVAVVVDSFLLHLQTLMEAHLLLHGVSRPKDKTIVIANWLVLFIILSSLK